MNKFDKIDQAVILMAGLGTRFLPATKAVAKELFPIENKPALLCHLQELYKSGIKRVCLVISKEKDSVKDFLKHNKRLEESLKNTGKLDLLKELNEIIDNMQIDFVYQGKMNGSGGAIYSTKKWTKNKPFALILGDDLCKVEKNKTPAIGQLMKAYEKTGKSVIGAKPFPNDVIYKYSSIVKGKKLFDKCFEMQNIIEKPAKGTEPSNLVGLARYVLTPDIYPELLKCPKFANGEVRFTDAVSVLAQQGKAVCFEFDAKYYDCGNKLEYVKCIVEHALEDKTISSDLLEYLKTLNKKA